MRLLNAKILLVLFIAVVAGSASCTKNKLNREMLDPLQLASGRMAGTWANPSNIVTPDNVPAEVFGTMRLVFTTDASGNPSKFLAENCPIVFGNSGAGTWTISGTQDSAQVNIVGVEPLDEFSAKVTGTNLTLSFYMGWENTDTKETGQGNFKVTLTRQ